MPKSTFTGRETLGYEEELVASLWRYAQSRPGLAQYLEEPVPKGARPPVFAAGHSESNVISAAGASPQTRAALLATLPQDKHHRWFRSMSSSQALAQSLFGNLIANGGLGVLEDIATESGDPLVGARIESAKLEHVVNYLGETQNRETNIDVLLQCTDGYRVAFECKLRETEIGHCSRPSVPKTKKGIDNPCYERDHCDGTYTVQHGRKERCSLTGIGVRYWSHAPDLFRWASDRDHVPCPLRDTYQLARNALAVCIDEARGVVLPGSGHVVLIYDARNPAFTPGGTGEKAYTQARDALLRKDLLRRCSWQVITARLCTTSSLRWLGDELRTKYGF